MTSTAGIAALAIEEGALQRDGELVQLVEVVRVLEPGVVLEIGTHRGGTLRAWCQCATDNALLISVDLPGGEFGGGYTLGQGEHFQTFKRNGQRMELLREDSHHHETRARVVDILAGRQIDFLFIDGDHTYEGVSQDFLDYSPFVRPGGVIAFHDVVPYPEVERCQVDRFWSEISPDYKSRVFRTDGNMLGCGIGVIEWPTP